ncbi:hypothetical protein K502DRAFT_368642 [Neoconidiobolus thromboides FSU 785]|nr:hypothetical protein K502DRAFT_368642 [Neoconidiobolus thromboides FSU 785]
MAGHEGDKGDEQGDKDTILEADGTNSVDLIEEPEVERKPKDVRSIHFSEEPEQIIQSSDLFPLNFSSSLPNNYSSLKSRAKSKDWNLEPESNYTVAADANDAYIKFQDRYPDNYNLNNSIRYSALFGREEDYFAKKSKTILSESFIQPGGGMMSPESDMSSYGTFKSKISEYDVILADGTKQKRTVSLSSNFEELNDINPLLSNSKTKINKHKSSLNQIPEVSETLPILNNNNISEPGTTTAMDYFYSFLPDFTLTQKKVIKSSLAYFIGSLLTFIPYFRGLIGTSSHMAAISCFFLNPGQSIGQFIESMAYGVMFVLFGLVVSYLSLCNMAFWNSYKLYMVADITTWLLFIGGASFILAYIKAKYPKPTVGKCIPNAFIFIYIVLVNYTPFVGDTVNPFKIYDLAKTLSSGILLNFIICTQLWPRWEADKLRADMVTSLESFKTGLSTIVKTFLLEEIKDFSPNQIEDLMTKNRGYFLTLKQRYNASYWEFHLEQEKYFTMGKVVDRLNRLGQKLGGLSSGIDAQKEILEMCGIDVNLDYIKNLKDKSKLRRFSKHSSIFNENKNKKDTTTTTANKSSNTKDKNNEGDDDLILEPNLDTFCNFLKFIGPPTKALTFTCKQAISHLINVIKTLDKKKDLPAIYYWNSMDDIDNNETISIEQLKLNIRNALELFDEAQSHAICSLYKRTSYDGRPTEEIFLVYFFVFALEEFANELILTIDSFEQMVNFPNLNRAGWFMNLKSQLMAIVTIVYDNTKHTFDKLTNTIKKQDKEITTDQDSDPIERPLHYPSPKTKYQTFRANLWYFLMSLRDYRIIFALKSSIAALLVSSPIYVLGYKELCKNWRIGWTLITLNLVMSPTIGASNIYGIYRLSGTVLGSVIAYIVYAIFTHDVISLTIISSVVAIPCLYIFVATSIPKFGQFTLLSYNLIVLTTYANRHDVEFSFEEYAFIRAASVTAGVFIGLIFCFFIFPYEARKELRLGLSAFFLNLSKLYMKLVEMYSKPRSRKESNNNNNKLLQNPNLANEDSEYLNDLSDFLDLELKLQRDLLELIALLPNTAHEPRLKGPFPTSTYKKMLTSSQILLDKFVAMRIVITHKEWQSKVREDFVLPLNKYRKDLVGCMILQFHILASTLVLKTPLPPYLPPAHQARKRLVLALRELAVVRNRVLFKEDSHHIVYYAFVVVLDDLIDELDEIAENIKSLFGVMTCYPLVELDIV